VDDGYEVGVVVDDLDGAGVGNASFSSFHLISVPAGFQARVDLVRSTILVPRFSSRQP
jgi:hypothetical protein